MSRPRTIDSPKCCRQSAWQDAQIKAGRCETCGKPRKNYWRKCDTCQEKSRLAQRERQGFTAWRPGKPGRPPVVKSSQ